MAESRVALVLGATGTVGRPLCQSLIEHGWQVHGAARYRDPQQRQDMESLGVRPVVFDAKADDPATLPQVDVLFLEIWDRRHIAGEHLEDCWELNFDAIGRVVKRYAGAADVVNGSTGSLYGPRADRPSRETDSPRPDTDYAIVRHAQEKLINFLCTDAGSRAIHLRYYHSNTPQRGGCRGMAEQILHGQSLGNTPDRRYQAIGLSDFVRCTRLAADVLADQPQSINVCHPHIWTTRSLAERLRQELGEGQVIFDCETGGAELSVWGDTERMVKTFGEPTEDIDDLIARACAEAKRSREV